MYVFTGSASTMLNFPKGTLFNRVNLSGFTISAYFNCQSRSSRKKIRKAKVSSSIKLAPPAASGRDEP